METEQEIKENAQQLTLEVVESDFLKIAQILGGIDREQPCIIVPDHTLMP